jgi:hypothetical protein
VSLQHVYYVQVVELTVCWHQSLRDLSLVQAVSVQQ